MKDFVYIGVMRTPNKETTSVYQEISSFFCGSLFGKQSRNNLNLEWVGRIDDVQ